MGTVSDIIRLFKDITYVDIVDEFNEYVYSGFYRDMADYIGNMKVIGIYEKFKTQFIIIVSE